MIEKTYLSLQVSRALAAEFPVGDPTGGPAYREMRAPAIAIVGMAASFSGMAAGSIMAGIAFAGSALTLVGSITGNKTLSTIGMVAGAIGGAGMAGLFGEAAQGATWGGTFGGAEAGASTAASNLSQTPAAGIGSQAPVVDGVQAMPVATPGPMQATQLGAPSGTTVGSAAALNAPSAAGLNAPGGLTGINAPGDPGMSGLNMGSSGAPLSMSPQAPQAGLLQGEMAKTSFSAGQGAGGAATAPKGFAGGMVDAIKGNPEMAKMLAQGASGLSEYLSGVPDAQLAALEAQTGYADARALQIQDEIAKEKRRRGNLNTGYQQVNQGVQVNPNANMVQQAPTVVGGGLIAGARA